MPYCIQRYVVTTAAIIEFFLLVYLILVYKMVLKVSLGERKQVMFIFSALSCLFVVNFFVVLNANGKIATLAFSEGFRMIINIMMCEYYTSKAGGLLKNKIAIMKGLRWVFWISIGSIVVMCLILMITTIETLPKE